MYTHNNGKENKCRMLVLKYNIKLNIIKFIIKISFTPLLFLKVFFQCVGQNLLDPFCAAQFLPSFFCGIFKSR